MTVGQRVSVKCPNKWPDLRGRIGVVLQAHPASERAQIDFERVHGMSWLPFDELEVW